MRRSKSVLVSGGAGYIGSHVVLALCDAGWRVVVIDNLSTGFDWALDPRATLVMADIADDVAVRTTMRYDVCASLHFAGSISVPESVADPLHYYRNNTVASRALIDSPVACGVRHFIFSSTCATYGMPTSLPIAENSPTRPINPYGISKLMTEMMLRDVAAAHALNYCALRYFNVAGADPRGRTGQSSVRATHLIKVALEAATGKRDHVTIHGTDFATADGSGVRDYIHVSDLATAHVAALELLIAEPERSHTLNCGYGRGYSVLEVLDAVDRASDLPVARRIACRRPGDPDALIADNSRILETLQWRPMHDDLDEIVRDALAWERALAGLRRMRRD